MSNVLVSNGEIKELMKDMGGGSHAKVVSASINSAKDSFFDDGGSLDPSKMNYTGVDASAYFGVDGNVAGAEYYKLTSSALVAGVQSEAYSLTPFEVPARAIVAYNASQRQAGEEHYIEVVSVDANGVPETTSVVDDPITISSIRILTNVAHITLATSIADKFKSGDRVVIYGMAASALNVGVVAITTVLPTQNVIILPLTFTDGTYAGNANAKLIRIAPTDQSVDACSFLLDGVTVANAIYVTKNAGSTPLIGAAMSFGTLYSDAVQSVVQPYMYSFTPRFISSMTIRPDSLEWASAAVDSLSTPVVIKRTQSVPNPTKRYAVRIRSRNLPNKSVPVANIISITKTGTTTATVVTDGPHTLTTTDIVILMGSSNQTNNPSSTTGVIVASIISPTSFTCVWGAVATATDYGGTVHRVNGGQVAVTTFANVRGFARSTNGYMMITTAAAPTFLVGDTVRVIGCRDNVGSLGIDGRYKVAHVTPNIWYATTTSGSPVITGIADTSLIAVGAVTTGSIAAIPANSYVISVQPGVGFTINANCTASTTNNVITQQGFIVEATGTALQPTTGITLSLSQGMMGGIVERETDLRVNFIKVMDYNRTPVEVVSGQNNLDIQESVPVFMTGGSTLAAVTTVTGVTTVTTVTTVAALTSMNQIAGIPANTSVYDWQYNAWANGVRANIS